MLVPETEPDLLLSCSMSEGISFAVLSERISEQLVGARLFSLDHRVSKLLKQQIQETTIETM